jgi:hypothetical protein
LAAKNEITSVPVLDVTYGLTEKLDNVKLIPNLGSLLKSNRIKNPSSAKLDNFYG